MSYLIFFAVNALILYSYYILAARQGLEKLHHKFIFIGLFSLSQIILTELLLGILSILYLPALIFLNVAISLTVIFTCRHKPKIKTIASQDLVSFRKALQEILHWENTVLIGLALIVTTWFTLAAYFLPPRGGADDIFYHLPPVYEFIVKHKIYLLPTYTLKYTFAFPLNAELVFMWPTIFFHNQQWTDFTQFIVAIYGISVVYGLSRYFKNDRRTSFFFSILFLLTPVVLCQAESNYIDVIVNVFYLATIYYLLRFRKDGRLLYLYSGALAGGLTVGMKYFMTVFWLVLQPLIAKKLFKQRTIHTIGYFLVVLATGGYWYLRNFVVLGSPLYPINIFKKNFGVFFSGEAQTNFLSNIPLFLKKVHMLAINDLGLTSFDGGFGLVFWGLAFPCWIYLMLKSIIQLKQTKSVFPVLFWFLFAFGFSVIMLNPPVEMQWTVRWGIYIIPIGFLALGEILKRYQDKKFLINYVRVYSVIAATVSVTLLSISTLPNYRLLDVVADKVRGTETSEFKYFKNSSWRMPFIRFTAEPLDNLTKDDPQGLQCYMAADVSTFWVTSLYGTKLQNRIWNFEDNPKNIPDAIIYNHFDNQDVTYIGKEFHPEDIAVDPRYTLVTATPSTDFYLKKDYLQRDHKQEILLSFYKDAIPELFPLMEKLPENISAKIGGDIPFLVSGILGYNFKYLSLKGEFENPVYWVHQQHWDELLLKNNLRKIYSLQKPVPGYQSEEFARIPWGERDILIYKNER